jgi:hypothetical protein
MVIQQCCQEEIMKNPFMKGNRTTVATVSRGAAENARELQHKAQGKKTIDIVGKCYRVG